jgi:glutamate formiminotransferase / formiminotetrahydrofolate cyclodeaminase
MKWLECVPNFSEGRNPQVIQAIADAIDSVEGVVLLHIDSGYDANRTVYTFAGEPDKVEEAAYKAILKASECIDMRLHQGEHPRMGACDVCPFVPLGEMAMQEAVEYSSRLGKKLGDAGIPVYLYEQSCRKPERRNLAYLRKGEYESIPEKLRHPEWLPDFGPAEMNQRFGMMALGARNFLIAYNINLDSIDVDIAKKIASIIRESGHTNAKGEKIPGLLPSVKAIGWWMESYQCAQVSTNITDFTVTGVKKVFDTVRDAAAVFGISVKGSELIGLIPERALLDAGEELSLSSDEKSVKIWKAIRYLGLNIEPEERILEWVIQKKLNEEPY